MSVGPGAARNVDGNQKIAEYHRLAQQDFAATAKKRRFPVADRQQG